MAPLKTRWRWLALAAPVAVGLLLLLSPLGRGLCLLSFDLLFLFRSQPEDVGRDNVIILNMDEGSCQELHQDPNKPWDRSVHAQLIRELKARGARVIVFDLLFDNPAPNPASDAQLAEAIRDHGNVVLASKLETTKDQTGLPKIQVLRPTDALATNSVSGIVNWHTESDQIIRRPFVDKDYTNLAWQAAVAFGRAPPNRLKQRWLNCYGPGGTLSQASYYRGSTPGLLPTNYFVGKAVFVGPASIITSKGPASDTHATAFSRWQNGRQTSGVELHATAFLNLIRGGWLQEFSPVTEVLTIVALGLVLGLGAFYAEPWRAALLSFLGVALIAAGVFPLASSFHRWFPWLIVCAGQLPVAFAICLIFHTQKLSLERDVLRRRVALAESLPTLTPTAEDRSSSTSLAGATTPSMEQVHIGISQPTPSPSDASALAPGALPVGGNSPPPIPNHRMLRRIGSGAYGEVWMAEDEIGSYHAVKVVFRNAFDSNTPYEREFRGIQKFTPISRSHPGFVHILHVGRNDPQRYFFYIMELGDDGTAGQRVDPQTYVADTLARRLQLRSRFSVSECARLGLDLAAALDHLHGHGLIHRDIKPSNIIYVNGLPKFADVGLVTTMTSAGKDASIVGTPGYLAPEGVGSASADIFSLGKLLYECCSGRDRMEFPALSGTLIADAALTPGFAALNGIILKACEFDVTKRYKTAAQLHADLSRISASTEPASQ